MILPYKLPFFSGRSALLTVLDPRRLRLTAAVDRRLVGVGAPIPLQTHLRQATATEWHSLSGDA